MEYRFNLVFVEAGCHRSAMGILNAVDGPEDLDSIAYLDNLSRFFIVDRCETHMVRRMPIESRNDMCKFR